MWSKMASQNGVQKCIKQVVVKSVEVGSEMVVIWEPSLVKKSSKKGFKNRPQNDQPQLRLPRALRGRGPAVSGENAGEVVVVGVVCRMWPRTKRNVVEAKELIKRCGKSSAGPSEGAPTPKKI